MIHGTSTCAVVGSRSAANTAVLPARFEVDDLMEPGVAAGPPHPDAGHDRLIVATEVHDAGLGAAATKFSCR